ncbi:MAG: hypothetical protein J5682_00325 [Prevotella sp.]|nr:hypothetical protein [Prevotella sp.]
MNDFIESVNLVGTWKQVSRSITPELENPELVKFYDNLTTTINSDFTYSSSNGETGTWRLKDRTIYTTWTYDGETGEETAYIESFERDQMVLSSTIRVPDNSQGKYYKMTVTAIRVK